MRDETGQTGKVSNKEVLDCNVGDTCSDCHVDDMGTISPVFLRGFCSLLDLSHVLRQHNCRVCRRE